MRPLQTSKQRKRNMVNDNQQKTQDMSEQQWCLVKHTRPVWTASCEVRQCRLTWPVPWRTSPWPWSPAGQNSWRPHTEWQRLWPSPAQRQTHTEWNCDIKSSWSEQLKTTHWMTKALAKSCSSNTHNVKLSWRKAYTMAPLMKDILKFTKKWSEKRVAIFANGHISMQHRIRILSEWSLKMSSP